MGNFVVSVNEIKDLKNSFNELKIKPAFYISEDIDTNILFFKRKDRYFGVRAGLKSDFESFVQFVVYSSLVEKVTDHSVYEIGLEQLKLAKCSKEELLSLYERARSLKDKIPPIPEIENAYVILNGAEMHWIVLESGSRYHSVFWSETESNLFRRSA